MGDESKVDKRIDYIKDRISQGFPKLAGSKLDKMLATDEIKYVYTFYEFFYILV